MPQFIRQNTERRELIQLLVDGEEINAFTGDTVLTAVLAHRRKLRPFEFAASYRSGFCLMGACQDCWVHTADGERVRACTSQAIDGMQINTTAGKQTA